MRRFFVIAGFAIALVCVVHCCFNKPFYPGVPSETAQQILNIQNEPGTICWKKAEMMADLFVDYGETAVVLAVCAPPRYGEWHALVRYEGELIPTTSEVVLCTPFYDIPWTKGRHITEADKVKARKVLPQ